MRALVGDVFREGGLMTQFEEHADGQMFFDELLKAQGGDSKAYEDFVDKFKPKKTTDDCFTPVAVYECVAEWVTEKYGVERSRMVRPFYPNGDYEAYNYPSDAVVVDNPPFSIIAQIVRFYARRGVKFFLFGPSLTLMTSDKIAQACAIPLGVSVIYENGAEVNTGFITNLEPDDTCLKSEPELFKRLDEIATRVRREHKKQLPKYTYPDHVVTAAMVQQYSKYGVPYEVSRRNSKKLRALNAQEEIGKTIFGDGLLLSDKAAAERAAAERAAAEKAAATQWKLSKWELDEVKRLSENDTEDTP